MRIVKKTIKCFLAVFITALILEIYFTFSEIHNQNIYTYDPQIYKKYKSESDFLFLNEGFALGRTNEGGYLGKFYSPQKDTNKIRIALIGDSFLQSFQLFDKHNLSFILESKLNEFGIDAQVLRFGYSGYEFENMFVLLEQEVIKYKPDYVIYFVNQLDLNNYSASNFPHYSLINDSLKFITFHRDIKAQNNAFELKDITILRFANEGFSKINETNIYKTVFDKFYYAPNVEYRTNFENTNRLTLKLFSKIGEMNRFTKMEQLFCINIRGDELRVSESYIQKLNDYKIKYFDLEPLLKKKEREGTDAFFWRATNLFGHWNHGAHKEIALFLTSKFNEIIKNKKRER